MTVYRLIELLTTHCGPTASFGPMSVWWSEKHNRLYLSANKPVRVEDAKRIDVDGGTPDMPEAVQPSATPSSTNAGSLPEPPTR